MTETIEYRTVDKSAWPRGAWDDEPDKVQWRDEATGFACLIVRSTVGALCGYVGVPAGHPWHGREYDDVEPSPDVHGGLTFAAPCAHGPDPSVGICHVPAPGEPDDLWWLGFDCAHWRDLVPALPMLGGQYHFYRDLIYVRAECARLAVQAAEAAR